MADQFSKLYDVERVGGDQRTRLAELLRSQGMNQAQGQMVGGWYVPPSWSQNINSALQMGLGTYMGGKIDEERKQKTAEILRQLSQGKEVEPIPAVQNFNGMEQMAEGQTPMPQQAPQNELQRLTQRPQAVEQSQMNPAMAPRQEQRYTPLTEEERIGKVMELAQYNPAMANIWSAQDAARQNRLTRAEERAVDREFKREMQQENLQGRMDMMKYSAMLRPAPAEKNITVMDEAGTPFSIPQSQMQPGMVLYTPQTAKAFKERQSLTEGKQLAADQIQNLRNEYEVLNKNMAIPSEKNRWGSNIGAWASGTPIGQWAGRIGGTESATARDVIRMSRPALMQTLVKASGMSAKQIDSNAEMKLMLDQATDPTAGYEANMKALGNLEQRFIGGVPAAPNLPNPNDIDAEIERRRKGR